MRQIYVNRYSERGRKLKRALNSQEGVIFKGIAGNRRQLLFDIPDEMSIRRSRRGKLYINGK